MSVHRIGVVSDTHIPTRARKMPPEVYEVFRGVELILHAGDLESLEVLRELESIAPVEAVAGNMDGRAVRKKLPERKVVEVAGVRIGLVHGSGAPFGLARRVNDLFREEDVEVVVFGHSHQAEVNYIGGRLLFNPGSPTDRIFSPARTAGLLLVDSAGGEVEPRVVDLDRIGVKR